MEQHYWGISLKCEQCKVDVEIQLVMFSADGELKFTYWCRTCKQIWHHLVYASSLAEQARRNDLTKHLEKMLVTGPVKPPLKQKLLPKPEFSVQDCKELRDMGITLKDKGET